MLVREQEYDGMAGLPVLFGALAGIAVCVWLIVTGAREANPVMIVGSALGIAVLALVLAGLFLVNPNEGRVLQLFGNYVGTARATGLRWANPFLTKRAVSLRVRNFERVRT